MTTAVLNFVCELKPKVGGVPAGIELITTNLKRYDIESSVISFGNCRDSIRMAMPRVERMMQSGVHVAWTNSFFRNPYGLGWNFNFTRKLKGDLNFSLVVLHQVYTLSTYIGYRFAKKRNIPYIVFPHGSLTTYHESDSRFIKLIAKKLIISRILQNSRAILVTCESEKSDLKKHLRSKSVLIPYGSDIKVNLFNSNVDAAGKNLRIIFSGRFDKKKNLPLLITAMSQVVSRYPEIVLDIAGSGSQSEINEVKNIARNLEVEKNIVFHNWIEKSDMEKLLLSSRLLVLPSQNENFALVVSEALSSGVPCVVSKFVGTSDIVRKYKAGEVLDLLSSDSIATAILKILEGDANTYREAAIHAAREELEWSGIAIKWKNLIALIKLDFS